MDYKEKYEQAFERAEKYHKDHTLDINTQAAMEYVFPELKESEDEKIKNHLLNWFKDCHWDAVDNGTLKRDDIIAWLEKQCEQKPTDKVEPKLKIEKDKWYVCIKDLDDDYGTRAFRKGDIYFSTKDETLMPDNSNIPYEIKYCVEDYFHLWTIQDAKDGDVVVCEGKISKNEYGQEIGIVKKYVGRVGGCDNCFETYCFIDWDGNFIVSKAMGSSNIHPATQEQRDLLFQKIKKSGYEWDAEKKELKKIEQEEGAELTDFESALFSAFSDAWQEYLSGKEVNVEKWAKEHSAELLEVARKQKHPWSKEDEIMLNNVISTLEPLSETTYSGYAINSMIGWLKSLKGRLKGA